MKLTTRSWITERALLIYRSLYITREPREIKENEMRENEKRERKKDRTHDGAENLTLLIIV